MPNDQDFDQFDDLIDDLQRTDERPYPPRAFKQNLRADLLNQYNQPRFSLAILGRLAGTAVAFTVLALVVFYAWNNMSPSNVTGAPVEVTRPVQPTPAPTIVPVEPELAASSFRDGPLLNRHALSAPQVNPGETLDVTLFWEGEIAPNSQVALHLTDASGVLFSQVDQPLTTEMTLSLPIPETLTDGVYEVVVVRYDAATGVRQDSFLLQEIGVGTAVASEQCPCVWLVSATQYPRTSVDDPITLSIDIAYQLGYGEKVILKPLYAHPDWSTAVDSRLPIDGLGDEIVLDGSKNTFGNETITFVENPAVMRDIVGTDHPVLVMQLRHLDEAGEPTSAVTMEALPTFTLDLKSTQEITYQMDIAGFESVPGAVVSGTDGNGLTLRSEPNGQQIGILEEGSVVLLSDDTLLESDGLLWQSVSTTQGEGWVVADFLEYSEGFTPRDTIPWSPDGLWIVKATQLPRSGPDEAITLEVTVGYELVTAEEALLSLSFVHPTWEESLDGYRYPNYNALGDEYAIQSGTGSVTFTATVEPETITSAINSDEFGLMSRLWATDENGRLIFGPILMGFDKDMTFNVQSVEEITYP
jgi:hypothetical protein